MNMFKSNGGFTLVELIVVIAILAILAGVAVPAYSGYIARANDAAITSELSAVQTAAQAACSMDGTTVREIKIGADGAIAVLSEAAYKTTSDTSDDDMDISSFYTENQAQMAKLIKNHSEYAAKGCTWTATSGKWEATK